MQMLGPMILSCRPLQLLSHHGTPETGLMALTDLLEEAEGEAMCASDLSQLPSGRCSCIMLAF